MVRVVAIRRLKEIVKGGIVAVGFFVTSMMTTWARRSRAFAALFS
jgi:hypothetical protein